MFKINNKVCYTKKHLCTRVFSWELNCEIFYETATLFLGILGRFIFLVINVLLFNIRFLIINVLFLVQISYNYE